MSSGVSSSPYVLAFPPRRVVAVLSGIALGFTAIYLALQYDRFHGGHVPWQIDQFFDLDEEQAAPNWFSSALLGFGSLLMAGIAGAWRRRRTPGAGRWAAMSVIMLYLSFDEVAGVHETVNSLSPISWTVPFGILALIVAAWLLPFALRLPRRTATGLIVAGFVYLMAAAGVEFITSRLFMGPDPKQFGYALLVAVEETGEMAGAIITIGTLLDHMRREAGAAAIALEVAERSTRG